MDKQAFDLLMQCRGGGQPTVKCQLLRRIHTFTRCLGGPPHGELTGIDIRMLLLQR